VSPSLRLVAVLAALDITASIAALIWAANRIRTGGN
jgi:hypothetical protein